MLEAGITGGIGSGKSVVCKLFSVLGIPSYSSDLAARTIVESDDEVITKIKAIFGKDLYDPQNKLDRKKLSEIVFKNAPLLNDLNNIIHPAVRKDFEKWKNVQTHLKYVLKEAAILFESGTYKDCDVVITIVAPLEQRINAVMKRDNISREKVEERISNQWSDEEKIKRSDFVIYNDNKSLIIPQVLKIHEDIVGKL